MLVKVSLTSRSKKCWKGEKVCLGRKVNEKTSDFLYLSVNNFSEKKTSVEIFLEIHHLHKPKIFRREPNQTILTQLAYTDIMHSSDVSLLALFQLKTLPKMLNIFVSLI